MLLQDWHTLLGNLLLLHMMHSIIKNVLLLHMILLQEY